MTAKRPCPPVMLCMDDRLVGVDTGGLEFDDYNPAWMPTPSVDVSAAIFGSVLRVLLRDPSFRLARPGDRPRRRIG